MRGVYVAGPIRRVVSILGAILLVFGPIHADGPAMSPAAIDAKVVEQLSQTFRGSMIQKPVRDACHSIAATSGVNLWFDPMSDPSTTVQIQQTGGTVWDALVAVTAQADLSISATATIVLIAGEDRLDHLIDQTHRQSAVTSSQRIAVRWPVLTTPNQAIESIRRALIRPSNLDPVASELPHDLLPASIFDDMRADVLMRLIRGSYLDSSKPVTATRLNYPVDVVERLRRRGIEPPSTSPAQRRPTATSDRMIPVLATWPRHREMLAAWIETEPVPDNAPPSSAATFTLRVKARAVDIFAHLAATANRRVQWSDDSALLRDTMVNLDLKDATLKQLVAAVAEQVGVTTIWTPTSIEILVRRESN